MQWIQSHLLIFTCQLFLSFSYTCSSFTNVLPYSWFRLAHLLVFYPSMYGMVYLTFKQHDLNCGGSDKMSNIHIYVFWWRSSFVKINSLQLMDCSCYKLGWQQIFDSFRHSLRFSVQIVKINIWYSFIFIQCVVGNNLVYLYFSRPILQFVSL